jgi:hypothetical protein
MWCGGFKPALVVDAGKDTDEGVLKLRRTIHMVPALPRNLLGKRS